jgi:hypothetical protein
LPPHLELLYINNVEKFNFGWLSNLNLIKLKIVNTKLNKNGFKMIKNIKKLEHLELSKIKNKMIFEYLKPLLLIKKIPLLNYRYNEDDDKYNETKELFDKFMEYSKFIKVFDIEEREKIIKNFHPV